MPRPKIILFHANYCGHCKDLLAQAWPDVEKEYGETYEIVKVEISTKDRNYELYESLMGDGVPQIVILDSEGGLVGLPIVGYANSDDLMTKIKAKIEAADRAALASSMLNYNAAMARYFDASNY